jgi:hypothetical protein
MKTVKITLSQKSMTKIENEDGSIERIYWTSWDCKPFNVFVDEDKNIDLVDTAKLLAEILDHQTKTKQVCKQMTSFSLDKKVTINIEVDEFMLNQEFLLNNARSMQMLKPRYSEKGEKVVRDFNSYNEYFVTLLDFASILMEERNLSEAV